MSDEEFHWVRRLGQSVKVPGPRPVVVIVPGSPRQFPGRVMDAHECTDEELSAAYVYLEQTMETLNERMTKTKNEMFRDSLGRRARKLRIKMVQVEKIVLQREKRR